MPGGHIAAVRSAIEVGEAPVTCSMAANRPPCRAGNPDAYHKHKADGRRGKDANRVFSVVEGVNEPEKRGSNPCRLPEVGPFRLVQIEQQAGHKTEQSHDVDTPNAVA